MPKALDVAADVTITVVGPVIQLHSLSVIFGDHVALENVSFSVRAGSACALVGRNGAGKSTCLRVLAGVQDPTAGGVAILGSAPLDAAFAKRKVGYLLDDQALFAYLTGAETLHLIGELYGVPSGERHTRVVSLLDFFDLNDNVEQLVENYSTGMQRRLALAAAMIHGPDVLILDEPFETLDPIMVRRLRNLLATFVQSGGAVLVSTHLMSVIEQFCDHVVVIDGGRVLIDGSMNEVLSPPESPGRASLEDAYVAAVVGGRPEPLLHWLHPRSR
jgi:ABC-2 type transport system ATP-binding protein